MANKIEVSKTGRATCRTCREGIEKGVLRFGEEVASTYGEGGTTMLWHHLPCAAKKKPNDLAEALVSFVGDVPDRAAIDALIAEHGPKQKPTKFPYLERASTGRARCGKCKELIAKGELRVATEREAEAIGMGTAARYWHAACVKGEVEGELMPSLRANSRGLTEEDFAEASRLFA
jgi:poly [ADP-ribose] polymerase